MSNAALAQDYLFIGPLIEARLAAEIAGNVPVERVEQMAQARDAQDLRETVLYVMWGGDRFDGGEAGRAGAGAAQRVWQQWLVWLRVRNAGVADKAARNTVAGPLLSAVHRALAGWMPEGALRTLQRTQGPAPNYQPASGLYPLAFEINLSL
ncbi:MAG: hypothetical protein HS128_19165 [Ideonella sp.]|nr:hypothetical protein [Ideonella sp.]MCC7455989.1 hypothetical protein [Nitrospira sp.]